VEVCLSVYKIGQLTDLADLDRDGFLDALCLNDAGCMMLGSSWGGQKGKETDLGAWMRGGYSTDHADLDGDGWAEIVMADKDGRLKIWRFDRRERRLKVIATSPPLPVTDAAFSLQPF
jgi:hypothetical protein